MNLQSINASASPEVQINENNETLDWAAVYGKRQAVTTGLTWGYYGGRWGGFPVTAGTISLTNNAENFISVARATGVISVESSTGSPSTAPNWTDTVNYARVYRVVTASGAVTVVDDYRAGPHGVHGYKV